MNDWQTGSSNVLLKLLIRYVFGFIPGFDALRVAPAGWSPFERTELAATAHGRKVRIVHTRATCAGATIPVEQRVRGGHPDPELKTTTLALPYEELSTSTENVVEVVDPVDGQGP